MLVLGCRPEGRLIEQHDVFFGIGSELKDLVPAIKDFWPEANGKIHIDAWREVNYVEGYRVNVLKRGPDLPDQKLFFINLGGYKEGEFEEYHHKILCGAKNAAAAIAYAKETPFYQGVGFKGAPSHVDDKYGIDVDEIYEIQDLLPTVVKEKYCIYLRECPSPYIDTLHIGYLKLEKI